MEIKQSRYSNRIQYVFGEDELHYSVQDGSGSRSFSVGYASISRDRQTLDERNEWLRNVGLLWLILGAAITAYQWIDGKQLMPSIWLVVGAACYAVYRLRTTSFTIVPSDKGNLLVIAGREGERILKEIETRRAEYFRREYDFMPAGESADQHRSRFKWLHKEGVLSDDELAQRLAAIEIADPARPGADELLLSARLN